MWRASVILALALAALASWACDDDPAATCDPDACGLLERCDPQLDRCVAPDEVPFSEASASPSLAATEDGQVFLSAYAELNGDLLVGVWDDVERRFRMQVVEADGDVGRDAVLQVFPDGRPAIAFVDGIEETLSFAEWDIEDARWRIEVVDQARVSDLDLAIDIEGTPHVAYRDLNNRILRYARRDERVWRIDNVDLGTDPPERIPENEACPAEIRERIGRGVGFGARVAVQGIAPVIAYHDGDCGTLRIARSGASRQWTLRVLDGWDPNRPPTTAPHPGARVGRFTDVAVDAVGRTLIAYYDGRANALRAVDPAGESELVDGGERAPGSDAASSVLARHVVGQMPRVAFALDGTPVVTHLDGTTLDLVLSYVGDDGEWVSQTVPGVEGFDSSLAVADDGTLFVAGVRRGSPAQRIDVSTVQP